jgi:carbamoyltransferase
MKILGIKLTHDAAVAGIDGNKLVFCVEMEKLNNNPRYSKMEDTSVIDSILDQFDFQPDIYAVDGWKGGHLINGKIQVAGYHEFDSKGERVLFVPVSESNLKIKGASRPYASFTHMDGHIVGAYVTSPFAKRKERSYVLTWDGGQNPRVHLVGPNERRPIAFRESLFDLYGIIYGIMGYYFGPYKREDVIQASIRSGAKHYGGYDKPGKLMAYIAKGKVSPTLLKAIEVIYLQVSIRETKKNRHDYNQDGILEHEFCRAIYELVRDYTDEITDADVLRTIHQWLENSLISSITAVIPKGRNLCFAGGSALNIKWNSALRNSGHFREVWVPPFPNDSGSAIGAAACVMTTNDDWWLDWTVYSGPKLLAPQMYRGWTSMPCSLKQLANILATEPDQPIVFLNGRAEIGPRALGNRSIICNPERPTNKTLLNHIKDREQFRPVAPICLEHYAPKIFNPGTPDPYMLFDHTVMDGVPCAESPLNLQAVTHLDGTARLQTVNKEQNSVMYDLLCHFHALTGCPLLCNTSANLNGAGFFPDVEIAMMWGRTKYIWSEGTLYSKNK